MSPSDSAFWRLESDVSRMHSVTLAILSGPVPSPAELEGHLAHRVPLVPRLRQRVVPVPLDLERPVWVDDPEFDLGDHLVVTSNPVGMAGLSELVSLIVSEPLDRDRPLWNLTLVTDLPDDQWALVSKVHHSLIDGVSGTDLLGVLVDGPAHDAPVTPWRPPPLPRRDEVARRAVSDLLFNPIEQYRAYRAVVMRERRRWRRLSGRFAAIAAPDESGLRGPVGGRRTWASVALPEELSRAVTERHDLTSHQLVLVLVAAGLRDLMVARDEGAPRQPDIRAVVPVAMADERGSAGSPVSATVVELPTGAPTLGAMVRAVREASQPGTSDVAASALTRLQGFAAPALATLGLREATRTGLADGDVQTVVVNVPGPREFLTLLGRRINDTYLVMPLAARVRVSVGVFSYAGHMTFGITADRDALPDARVVAGGIQRAARELTTVPPGG
jgi:WS/DGAT/MGAT family acyltransferase